MNTNLDKARWSENVIIADADYIDAVAFNLIVNFERMIGRRIPKADMARWIDCIALDGGLREGQHNTQVVLLHSENRKQMENFTPGNFSDELDGKAFSDNLGEFVISSLPAVTPTGGGNLFTEAVGVVCTAPEVKRVMIIPNAEKIYDDIRMTLNRIDDDENRITVFAMQPMPGGNFRQEILGYSLMSALGIRADEIKQD